MARLAQNRYGYTGRGRKLGDPMLQCEMCMQWFHAKDVEALKPEDAFVPFQRNYRFVCRICAGGREQLEFVTNTWSSVCLTSLYNLLLSEKGESSGASQSTSQSTAQSTSQSTAQSTVSLSGQSISQRAVKVSEIREWILHRWESSLTRGRNLQQLTENKAIERHLPPCLLYTSPSPRDCRLSRMPSSA